MPDYHVVYVTKLGVPFIEEAQEYPSRTAAVEDAAHEFSPVPDRDGRLRYPNVRVVTHDGQEVVLPGYDHLYAFTPEELQKIQAEERRQQQMMRGNVHAVPLSEESDE